MLSITHDTLRAYIAAMAKAGTIPSIAEVASELGASPTTTRSRLRWCVDQGVMEHKPGAQRAFRLTALGKRLLT